MIKIDKLDLPVMAPSEIPLNSTTMKNGKPLFSRSIILKKGQEFNELTVLWEMPVYSRIMANGKNANTRMIYCECSCGNRLAVYLPNLQANITRHCGCKKNVYHKRWGQTTTGKKGGARCSSCGVIFIKSSGKRVICKHCKQHLQGQAPYGKLPVSKFRELHRDGT